MPPKNKKQQGGGQSKAQKQKKAKDLEDKTFGLKNKNKSKRVQKQISQIQGQVDPKKQEALAKKRAAEKAAAEKAKKDALLLNNPIIQQKVPFGTDPKSVLCAYFKEGQCNKGDRCKFSHDLNIGRKSAKKDLYTDAREEKENDNMEDWDEEKLRKVVKSKQGNNQTTTDIVCKFFLDAVENCKYGWFWVCPNGGKDCKYKHSLPEGFVLKTKEQRRLEQLAADNAPKLTLEDFIEMEKDKLGKNLTPITPESFRKWKKEHQLKRLNEKKKVAANGKKIMTGREVIEQRFKDKLIAEGSYDAATGELKNDEDDDVWDLSEFQKTLREAEKDENIRDYGEGTINYFENDDQEPSSKSIEADGVAKAETKADSEVNGGLESKVNSLDQAQQNGDVQTTVTAPEEVVK